MMIALTLQHGNRQLRDRSQFCLQCSLVMPVSRELIGILASTMSAFPVDFAPLTTHKARTPFFSSSFRGYFRFQTGHQYLFACKAASFICFCTFSMISVRSFPWILATETVILIRDEDSSWRRFLVFTYFTTSRVFCFPFLLSSSLPPFFPPLVQAITSPFRI